MKKSKADHFYQALKDNPKEIIAWCEAEIKEYKKLIKLLKECECKDLQTTHYHEFGCHLYPQGRVIMPANKSKR